MPKPLVLATDLAEPDAAARIGAALADRALEPQYIVNNAGFGLVGRAAELDRDEQLGMIDLNMRALTDLSLSFVDSLARHRGGILNVASIAGVPAGARARRCTTPARPSCCRSARRCMTNSRRAASASPASAPVRSPPNFRPAPAIAEAEPPWPLAVSAERVAAAGYRGLMRGQRIVVPGWANRSCCSR